jgi:hypothetical protein
MIGDEGDGRSTAVHLIAKQPYQNQAGTLGVFMIFTTEGVHRDGHDPPYLHLSPYLLS